MLSKRFAQIQNNNNGTAFVKRRRRRRRKPTTNIAINLGIELKFYDKFVVNFGLVTATDTSGGVLNPVGGNTLSSMAQGNGQSQREGRRVTWKNIFITGVITANLQVDQTALDITPIVFLALVQDNQTNGLQFASQSVYINPSGSILLGTNLLRNLQQSKRFKILKTWRSTLPDPEATFDGTNIEQSGFHIPFTMFHQFGRNVVVNHSLITEGVTNSTDLSISLIGWTTQDTLVPLISYNSRLRYYG